jgi:hypothetical protein
MDSNDFDIEQFGPLFSEDALHDYCILVYDAVQAWYMSGDLSKAPYGLDKMELISRVIKGETLPGEENELTNI